MKLIPGVFGVCLCVATAAAAVPSPPPSAWKGVTYAPRYHPFWRMLYEYYDYDSRLGEYVYQAVDSDLANLSSGGFNLVHLYLWDQQVLAGAMLAHWCADASGQYYPGCTPLFGYDAAGFYNSSVSLQPTQTPAHNTAYTQGQALDDFLTRAENHGIFVMIHFVSGTLLDEEGGDILYYTNYTQSAPNQWYCPDYVNGVPNTACIDTNAPIVAGFFDAQSGSTYTGWAADFINLLARLTPSGPAHHNLLAVGFEYSFPNGSNYGFAILQAAYAAMYSQLQPYRLAVPGAGRMALDITFGVNEGAFDAPWNQTMFVRPANGFPWSVLNPTFYNNCTVQQQPQQPCLPAGQPDLYMIQAYNPNAVDLSANGLSTLTGYVPASDILVSEFATSSPIASNWDTTYESYLFMSYGDAMTPTGDQAFQASWTAATLCAFGQNYGTPQNPQSVEKFAYWTMYDAPTFFGGPPWYEPLDWWGYWGLGNESPSAGMKPVWTTLANYNPSAPSCPNYRQAPMSPTVEVSAPYSYVTVNEYPMFDWIAVNSSGATVNGQANSPVWISDCTQSPYSLDTPLWSYAGSGSYNLITTWGGSCALGWGPENTSTGTAYYTFQFQGMNGGAPYTTTIPITVGSSAIVDYVNGQPWSGQTVSQQGSGYLTINGVGFNSFPINWLIWQWSGGGSPIYMYNGDPYQDGSTYYFYSDSIGITMYLDSRMAPGLWYVTPWNFVGGYSATIPVQIY